MRPEVTDRGSACGEPEGAPLHRHRGRGSAAVEQGHGDGVDSGQLLRPYLEFAPGLANHFSLNAERVLVDRDHFGVREDSFGRRGHAANVVSGQQGRGHDRPHREKCARSSVSFASLPTSSMSGSFQCRAPRIATAARSDR